MRYIEPNCCSISKRSALLAVLLPPLALLAMIPRTAAAASSCRVPPTIMVSATGVSFGNYDVLNSADMPGTETITVSATCAHANLPFTVNYSIALNAGTGSKGSFTPRLMTFGANGLQYNLYADASLTTIWGDGSGGTQTVSDQITGTCKNPGGHNCNGSQSDTVYGNIPALQDVVPGSYSDNITVTVTF